MLAASGLALLGLIICASYAAADAPFAAPGATQPGSHWAFTPILRQSTPDSVTISSLAVGWRRYGARGSAPRVLPGRTHAVGFWRRTLYSSVGAMFESNVLGVPVPQTYIPGYWPYDASRLGDYAWQSDPALRRYLLPVVVRKQNRGRVDLQRIEKPSNRFD